jgi:hypothetical protein
VNISPTVIPRCLLVGLSLLVSWSALAGCRSDEAPLSLGTTATFELTEAPGATAHCPEPKSCVEDYLSLTERIGFNGVPQTKREIESQLDAIKAGSVPSSKVLLSGKALQELVQQATGASPLLELVPTTLRTVRIRRRWETPSLRGYELLIDDPYVGTWEATLLLPRGAGPFPALVASHGHADDAAAFLENQHGQHYPKGGFAVLAHTQRVSFADEHEDRVARALLAKGGSLMAIRSYEVLVGLSLLQSIKQVDPARIALIGHSGGTLANLLTVRLTNGFAAHVADGIAEYNSWDNGLIADESLPALYPHANQLSSTETAPVPTIQLEYGYPGGPESVLKFLAKVMPKRPPPR